MYHACLTHLRRTLYAPAPVSWVGNLAKTTPTRYQRCPRLPRPSQLSSTRFFCSCAFSTVDAMVRAYLPHSLPSQPPRTWVLATTRLNTLSHRHTHTHTPLTIPHTSPTNISSHTLLFQLSKHALTREPYIDAVTQPAQSTRSPLTILKPLTAQGPRKYKAQALPTPPISTGLSHGPCPHPFVSTDAWLALQLSSHRCLDL